MLITKISKLDVFIYFYLFVEIRTMVRSLHLCSWISLSLTCLPNILIFYGQKLNVDYYNFVSICIIKKKQKKDCLSIFLFFVGCVMLNLLLYMILFLCICNFVLRIYLIEGCIFCFRKWDKYNHKNSV